MSLQKLINKKRFDEAIDQCLELISSGLKIEDDEQVLTGKVYLAIIYTQQKRYSESIKIFDDNYLEILDECKYYWLGTELVNTYLLHGKYIAALNYINAFISENPDNFKALYLKGHILYLAKNFEESVETLMLANSINNSNKGVLYNLAMNFVELNQFQNAVFFFEKAYIAGNDKAIEEIVKLLFERTGICDYANCGEPCCKSVKLKGVNAQNIKTQEAFESLKIADPRNSCWYKNSEDSKGHWIFECKNFGEGNFCIDHVNRPQTCRDYPSSILLLRKSCSYHFSMINHKYKFSSKDVVMVLIDILESYKFTEESKELYKQNINLFE